MSDEFQFEDRHFADPITKILSVTTSALAFGGLVLEKLSDEQRMFTVKEFARWELLEADDGELPDDIIAPLMEFARSEASDGNEASDERVFHAYEYFKRNWTRRVHE